MITWTCAEKEGYPPADQDVLVYMKDVRIASRGMDRMVDMVYRASHNGKHWTLCAPGLSKPHYCLLKAVTWWTSLNLPA